MDFEFYYPAAVRSDISARSRAYQGLRQAGMPDDEVRRTLGFPPGESETLPTPDLPND